MKKISKKIFYILPFIYLLLFSGLLNAQTLRWDEAECTGNCAQYGVDGYIVIWGPTLEDVSSFEVIETSFNDVGLSTQKDLSVPPLIPSGSYIRVLAYNRKGNSAVSDYIVYDVDNSIQRSASYNSDGFSANHSNDGFSFSAD